MECPYCRGLATITTGKAIYPHRPDLFAKPFWRCNGCNAYVGCHPGTYTPLGSLANAELRRARLQAHAVFDARWRTNGGKTRKDAYTWLGETLGLPPNQCHIGMFDLKTCQRVIQLCKEKPEGGAG